jgi:hypothetical protein
MQRIGIRRTLDFSTVALKAGRKWDRVFKIPSEGRKSI